MTTTYMPLLAPVGATTADVGPTVRIIACFSSNAKPVVERATDAALAHAQAMRDLAALSFDPDSLDRESVVDIWGFHGAG